MLLSQFIFLIACALASGTFAAEKGTGLPVPRFVSIKSGEVNLRTGPGAQYPIRWVYKRAHLPLEVIEEFDQWRRVRDKDGEGGWVNKTMVSGKRTAIIREKAQNLHEDPDAKSDVAFKAEPGVIGSLLKCEPDWCKLQVEDHKGWIPKSAIWGAYKNEVFD